MDDARAVRPYYSEGAASAAFFDAITAADDSLSGDVDLYASLARRSVLELGSGTGRVAYGLAARGLRVIGIESATAMLALAEAKRCDLPHAISSRAKFVGADLLDFDLSPRRFDLVVGPFYILAHLPADHWPRALANAARHLTPGGRIALHMPDPDLLRRPQMPGKSPVLRSSTPQGDLTLYVAGQEIDGPRVSVDLDYEVRSILGVRFVSRERLTLFTGDVDAAAANAGLRPERAPIQLGRTGRIHIYYGT
jgi:SAM-dependent methyltransferase